MTREEGLQTALEQAIAMLESMPIDALGEAGTAEDSWPLRDEYLASWRNALLAQTPDAPPTETVEVQEAQMSVWLEFAKFLDSDPRNRFNRASAVTPEKASHAHPQPD